MHVCEVCEITCMYIVLGKSWIQLRGFGRMMRLFKLPAPLKFLYSVLSLSDRWIPLSLTSIYSDKIDIFPWTFKPVITPTTTTTAMLSHRRAKIKEWQLPVARENSLLKSIISPLSCRCILSFSKMEEVGVETVNITRVNWLMDWLDNETGKKKRASELHGRW